MFISRWHWRYVWWAANDRSKASASATIFVTCHQKCRPKVSKFGPRPPLKRPWLFSSKITDQTARGEFYQYVGRISAEIWTKALIPAIKTVILPLGTGRWGQIRRRGISRLKRGPADKLFQQQTIRFFIYEPLWRKIKTEFCTTWMIQVQKCIVLCLRFCLFSPKVGWIEGKMFMPVLERKTIWAFYSAPVAQLTLRHPKTPSNPRIYLFFMQKYDVSGKNKVNLIEETKVVQTVRNYVEREGRASAHIQPEQHQIFRGVASGLKAYRQGGASRVPGCCLCPWYCWQPAFPRKWFRCSCCGSRLLRPRWTPCSSLPEKYWQHQYWRMHARVNF